MPKKSRFADEIIERYRKIEYSGGKVTQRLWGSGVDIRLSDLLTSFLSLLQSITSSSAVAKRPRDASCLSGVNFNSSKRRTESIIVSSVVYRFITACN